MGVITLVNRFLSRCMECRRGITLRKVSVRPSVRMSLFLYVTRVNCDKTEDLSKLLYYTIDRLAYFSEKMNDSWGRPLLPEISGQLTPVGAKSPILNRHSLAVPQPKLLAKKILETYKLCGKHSSQKCNFRRKTAVLPFWNLMYRACVISIENRRVCPNGASLMIRDSQREYHTDHLRARTSVSYRVAQKLFAVESCGF